MRVIARAYRDKPSDLYALKRVDNFVVLANSEAAELDEGRVAFPENCVYRFNADLFAKLKQAWDMADQRALDEAWRQACLLNEDELPTSHRSDWPTYSEQNARE